MRGTVIYGANDVRSEELPKPSILAPTDAIVRNAATCVCGSDLWDYRGINPVPQPKPFGHEYCLLYGRTHSVLARRQRLPLMRHRKLTDV